MQHYTREEWRSVPHILMMVICAGAAPHKGKRAIELSLQVAKVNEGIGPESLTAGLQLAACVRSIEDHGFLLSLGIQVTCYTRHCLTHLTNIKTRDYKQKLLSLLYSKWQFRDLGIQRLK